MVGMFIVSSTGAFVATMLFDLVFLRPQDRWGWQSNAILALGCGAVTTGIAALLGA